MEIADLRASPHTRGWTAPAPGHPAWTLGFPAHAGMDPPTRTGWAGARRLPRTRGDGPAPSSAKRRGASASPHTRGWTPASAAPRRLRRGFPAHAGMDPTRCCPRPSRRRLPRTRGDGPRFHCELARLVEASPHTRGWTRGSWKNDTEHCGFPAHAGMDPRPPSSSCAATRLPRTRGDGPMPSIRRCFSFTASPHTRGWTPRGMTAPGRPIPEGFPAHAGMDLVRVAGAYTRPRLPRTRGDGPGTNCARYRCHSASPHTRGWTRLAHHRIGRQHGFPAHAGMDPRASSPGSCAKWLPRTRGDGPFLRTARRVVLSASPHTRGWTRRPAGRAGRGDGFPAHAGMDPADGHA